MSCIQAEEVIEARKVRDWSRNLDVQNRMKRDLDDLLYELEQQHGMQLGEAELDMLIEQVLEVAKARDGAGR